MCSTFCWLSGPHQLSYIRWSTTPSLILKPCPFYHWDKEELPLLSFLTLLTCAKLILPLFDLLHNRSNGKEASFVCCEIVRGRNIGACSRHGGWTSSSASFWLNTPGQGAASVRSGTEGTEGTRRAEAHFPMSHHWKHRSQSELKEKYANVSIRASEGKEKLA